MKKKSIIIIFLSLAIIIALVYGFEWIKNFIKIDECLDKGGRWNYELGECEYVEINSKNLTDFYWHVKYDTIMNNEFLVKGSMIDSVGISPNSFVQILNQRETICKIEIEDIAGDTIRIKIIDDEYLSEKMGTTGAYCYIAETVFTLTENNLIEFVRIEMNYGSHASPGIYDRNDFTDLLK